MRSLLLALVLTLVGIQTASAGCSTTVYSAYQTAYPYQTLAAMGSNKPVAQLGSTVACSNFWFDLFSSKDLSGNQTFGNEVDLTAAYDSSFATSLGIFKYEAYASYGAVPDFATTRDDIMELHAELSRPFVVGTFSFTPYVRPIQIVGFGVYPDRNLIRYGIYINIPIATRLSFAGDVAVTSDLLTGISTKRFVGGLYLDVGSNFTLQSGVKLAEGLRGAAFFGVSKKL